MRTKPFYKIKETDIPDMLKLKMEGWSFADIGFKYGINHTTVYFHIKKLGKKYPKTKQGGKRTRRPTFSRKLKLVKTYKDYLEAERLRVEKISNKRH